MPFGVVKWFDAKKGFGFINGPGRGKDIFVHWSVIDQEGYKRLRDGDAVEYELAESTASKGLQAKLVRRVRSAVATA